MKRTTVAQRLRYRFDNLMARGTGAQIVMLALATLVLILLTAIVLVVAGLAPASDDGHIESFGKLMWQGLMHTLDSGAVGGDSGSWGYLFVMLGITLGGIFVLSALIGILTGGFGQMLDNLRKGRSLVVERDHTVILGFGPKVASLLTELAEANRNRAHASVVILAPRDKVEMDDAVRDMLGDHALRVITRTGNPLSIQDLSLVSLGTARAVIVLSPEHDATGAPLDANEADAAVLKTLLAVAKAAAAEGTTPHVVCEVQSERTLSVARMVVGESAGVLHTPPLISRLLVQTGRQSGLSVVYTELLSFSGDEIYIQPEPSLTGKTFRDALFAYDDSAVLGVSAADGKQLLPPPLDRVMLPGDQIIAISRDDDTVVANGAPGAIDAAAVAAAPAAAPAVPERTLVLGDSERLELVLRELDAYVAPGSTTLVVGEEADTSARLAEAAAFRHMKVSALTADITDRSVLDRLDVASFDHVLVLAETTGRSQEMADARTMITLLHLRDLLRRAGARVPVTTEMLEGESRELAAVAEADDFIVSNALISLVVCQVSENRRLARVFEELLSPEGYEIYLKPAGDYVVPGAEVDFYTVVEAALRRGHVALGYRLAAQARDAAASYGVKLNPKKRERARFTAEDRIVVLAER